MIRRHVVATLLVLLFGLQANASSIICRDQSADANAWVKKYYALANTAILGKLISEEYVAKPEQVPTVAPEAARMAGLLSAIEAETLRAHDNYYQQIEVMVVKHWKGEADSKMAARNLILPAAYGKKLVLGKVYRLFAFQADEGNLTISTVCGLTLEARAATDRIAALDWLAKRGDRFPAVLEPRLAAVRRALTSPVPIRPNGRLPCRPT